MSAPTNANVNIPALNTPLLDKRAAPGGHGLTFGWLKFFQNLQLAANSSAQLVAVPASHSATGTTGQMAIGGGFLYVCVATNSWMRVALTSF